MRRHIFIAGLILFGTASFGMTIEEPTTYYVQHLYGTNAEVPPVAGIKLVGPKLSKALKPVFRWTNYWEMSRCELRVTQGKKNKVRLSNTREVEIDLSTPQIRKVTAFQDGKVVIRTRRPIGDAMTIVGGDHDENGVWFIVVRRDKPNELVINP